MQSLFTGSFKLPCGYGPRVLRKSKYRKAFFVGCKDGTVLVVSLDEYMQQNPDKPSVRDTLERIKEQTKTGLLLEDMANPGQSRGVRAICEWDEEHILVGRNDGKVNLFNWEDDSNNLFKNGRLKARSRLRITKDPHLALDISNDSNSVSLIEKIFNKYVIISRKNDSHIYKITQEHILEMVIFKGLPKRIICTAHFIYNEAEHYLLIDHMTNAKILKMDGNSFKLLEVTIDWKKRPGFIEDYDQDLSANKINSNTLYLSTSLGAFLINLNTLTINDQNPVLLTPEKLELDGIDGMVLAITHHRMKYENKEEDYLWVSDDAGVGHLYQWKEKKWHQIRLLQNESQVLRACRVNLSEKGPEVLCQVLRYDQINLAIYHKNILENEYPLASLLAVQTKESSKAYLKNIEKIFNNRILSENNPELAFVEILNTAQKKEFERTSLLEYLSTEPNGKLAYTLIELILTNNSIEKRSKLACVAIELWTHALLSIINRHKTKNTFTYHMGVIQWLTKIAAHLKDFLNTSDNLNDIKSDEIEKIVFHIYACIRFVRKWSIYGKSYKIRLCARVPLDALDRQSSPIQEQDRMVYRTLLLTRKCDTECVFEDHFTDGKTALGISKLPIDGGFLLGVSWSLGGMSLVEVIENQNQILVKESNLHQVINRSLERAVSHDILLGTIEPGLSFLIANRHKSNPEQNYPLTIFTLSKSYDNSWQVIGKSDTPLQGLGKVQSLLQINQKLILAGFQGKNSHTKILFLEIDRNSDLLILKESRRFQIEEIPAAFPFGASQAGNPAWCLVKGESKIENIDIVFLGCDDGRIWRLEMDTVQSKVHLDLIAQLGVPIRALAYRSNYREINDKNQVRRLFAGCADGTVLALQQIRESTTSSSERVPPVFTVLWATQEPGIISAIESFDFLDRDEKGQPSYRPTVVALTQNNRALVLSDQELIDPPRGGINSSTLGRTTFDQSRRPTVPGTRLARIKFSGDFPSPIRPYAGILLQSKEEKSRPNPIFANTLALASGNGRIQICKLHSPLCSKEREAQYQKALKDYQSIINRNGASSFYALEAALPATGTMPQVLIRLILSQGLTELDHEDFPNQQPHFKYDIENLGLKLHEPNRWLPFYFQPLWRLRESWRNNHHKTRILLENTNLDIGLFETLNRVYSFADVECFKEIIDTTLARANIRLTNLSKVIIKNQENASQYLAAVVNEQRIYFQILHDINQAIQLWDGSQERFEIKLRMKFIKSMVDGITMFYITTLALELENGNEEEKRISEIFSDTLAKRIWYARQTLVWGDAILSLETLRACNMSILRTCICSSRGYNSEMPWVRFKELFATVSDYATRLYLSATSPSYAVTRELARIYALGICATPSSCLALSHQISEAGLPKQIIDLILDQTEILKQGGMTVPNDSVLLFEWSNLTDWEKRRSFKLSHDIKQSQMVTHTEKRPGYKNFKNQQVMSRNEVEALSEAGKGKVNAVYLLAYIPFEAITLELDRLRQLFLNHVGEVNFSQLFELRKLMKFQKENWIENLCNVTIPYPYIHSYSFWNERLFSLEKIIDTQDFPKDTSLKYTVNPKLILKSPNITEWVQTTKNMLFSLKEKHLIFEPEYSIWKNTLKQLFVVLERFRKSSAVQNNIVLGVLNHGLLETLDEHMFELEEIATAIDPFLSAYLSEEGALQGDILRKSSKASQFAYYLLQRAFHAQSVPKNLRTLQALLTTSLQREQDGSTAVSLKDKMQQIMESTPYKGRWEMEVEDEMEATISEGSFSYICVALHELDQNHIHHGDKRNNPKVTLKETKNGPAMKLNFPFYVEAPETNSGEVLRQIEVRLKEVKNNDLNSPVPPLADRSVPSHGTGLYLANLAVSVIGWALTLKDPKVKISGGVASGCLEFVLTKHDKE